MLADAGRRDQHLLGFAFGQAAGLLRPALKARLQGGGGECSYQPVLVHGGAAVALFGLSGPLSAIR